MDERNINVFQSYVPCCKKNTPVFLVDAAYGTDGNYAYALEQQANVMLRISPNNFCVYDAKGNKID